MLSMRARMSRVPVEGRTDVGRLTLVALGVMLCVGRTWGAETVTVPWKDFQRLWTENMERSLRKKLETAPVVPTEDCIDRLELDLRLGEDGRAQGILSIQGRLLRGQGRSIPLVEAPTLLLELLELKGASLVQASSGGAAIRPEPGAEGFSARMRIQTRLRRDRSAPYLALPVPLAVRNEVRLDVPEGWTWERGDGQDGEGGIRHYAPGSLLELRVRPSRETAKARRPEIDSFFQVEPLVERVGLHGVFLLRDRVPGRIRVDMPEGMELLSSDLPAGVLEHEGPGVLCLRLPDALGQFRLRFRGKGGIIRFPRIRDNGGREGAFVLREPEEAELILEGAEGLNLLPVDRLPAVFRDSLQGWTSFRRLAPETELPYRLRPLGRVSAPAVVLDRVELLATVEEEGAILSVLRFTVPQGAGPRLRFPAVAGARIWSLQINGRPSRVFASPGGEWVLPLAESGPSSIELAFLRQGAPLGLRGRISIECPATGLAARRLVMAVALPERIELVSVDGPVTASRSRPENPPPSFEGMCHAFEKNFDEGKGASVALSYKEPVANRPAGRKQ